MRSHDAASSILVAAIEGTELSSDELAFFEGERPAGVTLFKRNIAASFSQTTQLCQRIQAILGDKNSPAMIAIDQEGGRVTRIGSPFPNLGPAEAIGDGGADSDTLATLYNYGFLVAHSLLGMGINVNFAPVCDVNSNPNNTAIGDRAFSSIASEAAERAKSYLDGLQSGGVLGCIKHFPGQGDAGEDTHVSGTVLDLDRDTLNIRELVPFKELIPKSSMVMISHAIFTSLDSKPASLSSVVMNDLLRGELGFDGVIVTDDMNMKAIPQDKDGWGQAIVSAVRQGADMVLVCRGLDRSRMALDALRQEAKVSVEFSARLNEAAHRMSKLRSRLSI